MSRPSAIVPVGNEEKWHRMMVYGEPGVGKTVFAGTSPKCLILSSNQAETMSAAGMGSTADTWVCESYEDIDEAYEYLRHEGYKDYDWVWVDNLTMLQDQAMDRIMAELKKRKPERNQWVPDQHEYLVNQNRLSTMVRSFLLLKMNVGYTAHLMRTEDDDGRVLYLPMMQGGKGQLSQKVCSYMNIVGFMQSVRKEGEIRREMILEKRSKYLAKGRFPGMSGTMTDPTVPKLESAIAASLRGAGGGNPRKTTSKTNTTPRKRVPRETEI
jgi:hypothetical protein